MSSVNPQGTWGYFYASRDSLTFIRELPLQLSDEAKSTQKPQQLIEEIKDR